MSATVEARKSATLAYLQELEARSYVLDPAKPPTFCFSSGPLGLLHHRLRLYKTDPQENSGQPPTLKFLDPEELRTDSPVACTSIMTPNELEELVLRGRAYLIDDPKSK